MKTDGTAACFAFRQQSPHQTMLKFDRPPQDHSVSTFVHFDCAKGLTGAVLGGMG